VPALKASLPVGALVEITCPQAAQALPQVERLDGVSEVALFGATLHAILDDVGLSHATFINLLDDEPTLQDVTAQLEPTG